MSALGDFDWFGFVRECMVEGAFGVRECMVEGAFGDIFLHKFKPVCSLLWYSLYPI